MEQLEPACAPRIDPASPPRLSYSSFYAQIIATPAIAGEKRMSIHRSIMLSLKSEAQELGELETMLRAGRPSARGSNRDRHISTGGHPAEGEPPASATWSPPRSTVGSSNQRGNRPLSAEGRSDALPVTELKVSSKPLPSAQPLPSARTISSSKSVAEALASAKAKRAPSSPSLMNRRASQVGKPTPSSPDDVMDRHMNDEQTMPAPPATLKRRNTCSLGERTMPAPPATLNRRNSFDERTMPIGRPAPPCERRR